MFFNSEVAYKYKMSSLQAALGLAQLERIDELIERKRRIFNWYRERLTEVEGVTLNYEAPTTKNTYWMVTIIFDRSFNLEKEWIIEQLRKKNIDSRPFFYPLSSLPAYENLPMAIQAQRRNTVSYEISPYGINLPSALNLKQADVAYVCDAIKAILL